MPSSDFDCAQTDLVETAQTHANQGLASQQDILMEACAGKTGDLDLAVYQEAYLSAQKIFCAQSLNFEYGLQGGSYEDICPVGLDADYRLGYDIFEVRYEIWSLENKIKNRERRISTYIDQNRDSVSDYQKEIRTFRAEIGRLRLDLIELKNQAKSKGMDIE